MDQLSQRQASARRKDLAAPEHCLEKVGQSADLGIQLRGPTPENRLGEERLMTGFRVFRGILEIIAELQENPVAEEEVRLLTAQAAAMDQVTIGQNRCPPLGDAQPQDFGDVS